MTVASAAGTRVANSNTGILAVVAAVVGLSTGSTLVKLADTPGPVVAFWRLLFGAALWAIVVLVTHTKVTWRTVRIVLPAGILFGLDLVLFFSAVRATRVANAEFIGTLTPLFTMPLAALVLHERVRWRAAALALPALAGVALIVFNSPSAGESSTRGNLLALGAMLSWSGYLLVARSARHQVDTVAFMLPLSVIAALVVGPTAMLTSGGLLDLSAKAWLLCLVLAIVTGTVSHGLLLWAQRHVEIAVISVLQVAQPALAATWAWLFLDESLVALQVAGMVIVLASLAAFTWRTSRAVA